MLHVPYAGRQAALVTPSYGTERPAVSTGVGLTPAVGSKGSWSALGTALVAAAIGILVNVNTNTASAASRNTVIDIGVDEAGGTAFSTVIPDLFAGGVNTYSVTGGGWYYFPLKIPAGATLGARAEGTVTSTVDVNVITYHKPSRPEAVRVGSFVEALGITAPAGVTNSSGGTTSEGAWNLIGTTTRRCWWWQFALQYGSGDTSWNAGVIHADLAVGDGSLFDIIAENCPFIATSAEALTFRGDQNFMERDCPAGSAIYARLQSSTNLDTIQWAAWGLGG